MKILVTIVFRDDTSQTFDCFDYPTLTDWVIIYCNDEQKSRKLFPKEAIKNIEYHYEA